LQLADTKDAGSLKVISGSASLDEFPTDICCKIVERFDFLGAFSKLTNTRPRSQLEGRVPKGQAGQESRKEDKSKEKFAELLSRQNRVARIAWKFLRFSRELAP
jgi:hypothetical protein